MSIPQASTPTPTAPRTDWTGDGRGDGFDVETALLLLGASVATRRRR